MPKLVNVKLDLKLPGIGGIAGTWEPDESEIMQLGSYTWKWSPAHLLADSRPRRDRYAKP